MEIDAEPPICRSLLNDNPSDHHALRKAIQSRNKDMVLHLVKSGIDINYSNNSYLPSQHPLHLAIISRCPVITKILLDRGADTGAKDIINDTPLILAAKIGNMILVEMLLSHNVKNCANDDKLSHLHISCMANKVSVIRKLIMSARGKNINAAVNNGSLFWPGYTPLHFAVHFGCIDAVKYLLKCGADITIGDSRKSTPLHLADSQRNEEIIDLLLAAHRYEFRNPVSSMGISHFHIACTRDNISTVEHFLKLGENANLDVRNTESNDTLNPWNRWRPIYFAVYYRCSDVVRFLLKAGARLDDWYFRHLLEREYENQSSDIFKLIATERSAFNGYYREFNEIADLDLPCINNNVMGLEQFLSTGVTTNPFDYNIPILIGCTPLHLAVKYNSIKATESLLDQGANINVQDYKGETPIHIAFNHRYTELFNLMLKNLNNDIENVTSDEGLTVFHMICTTNQIQVAKKFMRAGLNINAQVGNESVRWAGFTAIHFACLFKQTEMIEFLLQQQAHTSILNDMSLSPYDFIVDHLNPYHPQQKVLKTLYMIITSPSDSVKQFCDGRISPLHLFSIDEIEDLQEMQQYIIQHPNEINDLTHLPRSCSFNRCTPLHLAMLYENYGRVKLLLEYGADPFAKNSENMTPLQFWFNYSEPYLLEYDPVQIESWFMLGTPAQGLTPDHFYIACTMGFLNAVEFILDNVPKEDLRKSYINHCGERGQTPLHSLLNPMYERTSITEIVYLLLKNGADVNVRNYKLETPLLVACSCDEFNDLSIFLKYGADINARDVYGRTALHIMASSRSLENSEKKIISLLENGADINLIDERGYTCLLDLPLQFDEAFDKWNRHQKTKTVIFLKHVKKLQLIGRCVSEMNSGVYSVLAGKFHQDGWYDEESFIRECENELNLMETVRVNHFTSLKDILCKSDRELAIHCENTDLQMMLETENFYEQYPVYGFLVVLQMKCGRVQRSLLVKAKDSLMNLIKVLLPRSCLEEILQYLTNEDLENIIKSEGEKLNLV
ncbi:hypothetical protein QAD02_010107 [Eretmocerus hayati]|uniref:Uncharacterized protein n=1 Tax=Eretmocerus hayati TaxID=131215 RepID=A0ACC2NBK9_9HYME|nr:hypothetical protein QAD02_010107 [Eretmocerus hayati]